jgi:hypothetical protein
MITEGGWGWRERYEGVQVHCYPRRCAHLLSELTPPPVALQYRADLRVNQHDRALRSIFSKIQAASCHHKSCGTSFQHSPSRARTNTAASSDHPLKSALTLSTHLLSSRTRRYRSRYSRHQLYLPSNQLSTSSTPMLVGYRLNWHPQHRSPTHRQSDATYTTKTKSQHVETYVGDSRALQTTIRQH